MKQIMSLVIMSMLAGCVSIPEADATFTDRRITLGLSQAEALRRVEARGFKEVEITPATKSVFIYKTKKFGHQQLPFTDTVQRNLGFTSIVGNPRGNLRCFHRHYTRIVSSGMRIICWTADDGGKVTWRQAGWKGASL